MWNPTVVMLTLSRRQERRSKVKVVLRSRGWWTDGYQMWSSVGKTLPLLWRSDRSVDV